MAARIASTSFAPKTETESKGEGGVNVLTHSTPSRSNSLRQSPSPIPATQARHTSPRSKSQTTTGDTPGFGEDPVRRQRTVESVEHTLFGQRKSSESIGTQDSPDTLLHPKQCQYAKQEPALTKLTYGHRAAGGQGLHLTVKAQNLAASHARCHPSFFLQSVQQTITSGITR